MDDLWELFTDFMLRVRRDYSFTNSPDIRKLWKDSFEANLLAKKDDQPESIRYFLLQLSNTGR